MKWDWKHLRQQGFLSVSIVICAALLLGEILPAMDLREALLTIAILAFLLGWVP